MEKYLIGLDLDGTLLSGLYNLSDYSRKVFKKMNEQGHKIVITTGRPFRSSFFVYYKFGLDTPLINYNGQYITNPKDKTYVPYIDTIKKEIILDIYNKTKDLFYLFFSEADDNIYSNIDDKNVYELMHHNFLSNLFVGDLNRIIDRDIHGTLILSKQGCGKKIMNYITKNYDSVGARMWEWKEYKEIVEIYSLKSNKGTAFKKVREELGYAKESTIACGDSKNDIEFFDEAGLKIVPKNAEDCVKVKADIILNSTASEDAFAHYFNDKFNLGIEE